MISIEHNNRGQSSEMRSTFGEDSSPIRLRNAALNFHFLRRLAVNLFRADTSRSASLPKMRKAAVWNPGYLATVLRLRET